MFLAFCGTTMHAQATRDVTTELTGSPDAPHIIMEKAIGSEGAQDENRKLRMAAGSRQLKAKSPQKKDTSPKKKSGKISAAALKRKRARKAARIAARRRARVAARRRARRAARRRRRRANRRTRAAPTPGWIPAVGQT